MSIDRLQQLVRDLVNWKFETLHNEPSQVVVRSSEDGSVFALLASGDWIQAAQILVDEEELRGNPHRQQLGQFVLTLHGRFLGCRMGYDHEGSLAVQQDLYPDEDAEHVALVLGQMGYVATSLLPLLEQVLAGDVVDEDRVELALQVVEGAG